MTMHTTRFFPNSRAPLQALVGAAFALYACSFQDFDYLQKGPGVGGAANSGGGGQVHTGGKDESGGKGGTSLGGSTGGKPSQGGTSASGGASDGGGGASAGAGGDEQGGDGGAVTGRGGGQGNEPGHGGAAGAGGDGDGGVGGVGGGLVGNLLTNPSFELGLSGWTVDPSTAITNRYVYTQAPTSGGTTVDGSQEIATWHETAEYEIFVYQVVKKLTPGTYSFKGNFSSTQSRGAYLFARNCGGAERQVVIPTTAFAWFEVAIPDIAVTTDSCEVGFSVHNVAQDWLNADMFTFEKVP